MGFQYLPNTYEKNKIDEKQFTDEEFLQYQIKYRNAVQTLLEETLNFKKIDSIISSCLSEIPKVEESEYNFYHYKSAFKNQYIFLRNNIHIERLSDEELNELRNYILCNTEINKEFINKTITKVLFEDGDYCFVGIPNDSTKVPSKSIIIEFAYNQKKCTSLKQIADIKNCYTKIKEYFDSITTFELPIFLTINKSI